MSAILEEIVLSGLSICRGIAIGRLYLFRGDQEEVPHVSITHNEIEQEIHRYRQAIRKTRQEIRNLQAHLRHESIPEGAAILEGHLQMIRDPMLSTDIERQIRALGKNAEYIFHQTLQQFRVRFNALTDPYFRERSRDMEDVGRRIMSHLTARQRSSLADIPSDSIVFARDLTLSLVAEANQSKVAALITEAGGATSHAAIVARAKGIPYISSIPFERLQDAVNAHVILDGSNGTLILYPNEKTLKSYKNSQTEIEQETLALQELGTLNAETVDGYHVGLSANIDVDNELEMLHQYGGHGVGLYRSEFLCLSMQRFPTEEEQVKNYQHIVDKLKGLPIVIRTFDIGGDKLLFHQQIPTAGNQFLGRRAIRFLLQEKEIFRTHLRAILRVAFKKNVSIMFPMVSALTELREAKEMVYSVQRELKKEKIPYGQDIKIGCMIEVPSAAIISDLLAAECDFLSIGTNDLVQYSLAVDRSDQALDDLYTPTHPGIIRLIQITVASANRFNIPVSVCGEIAADPRFVPLLLGLGVRSLSVATCFLPEVKRAIRRSSIVRAVQLAQEALRLTTATEIDELLTQEAQKTHLAPLNFDK